VLDQITGAEPPGAHLARGLHDAGQLIKHATRLADARAGKH
jgi:hypothetical protein